MKRKLFKSIVSTAIALSLGVTSVYADEMNEPMTVQDVIETGDYYEIPADEMGVLNNDNTRANVYTLVRSGTVARTTFDYYFNRSDVINVFGEWTPGTAVEYGITQYIPSTDTFRLYSFDKTGTSGIISNTSHTVGSAKRLNSSNQPDGTYAQDGYYYYYVRNFSLQDSNVSITFHKYAQ